MLKSIKNYRLKLCSFSAIKGNKYDNNTFIVGRAVNGWDTDWFLESITDDKALAAHLEKIKIGVKDHTDLDWVHRCWKHGKKEGEYNTAKSAFWRVIKKSVQSKFNYSDEDWAQHIIWSNLYKIAHGGENKGNPSASLKRMQKDACRKILNYEIKTSKPKNVIFFTGEDWFMDFFGLNTENIAHLKSDYTYMSYSGTFTFDSYQTNIIVTKHPQGKKEEPFSEEIISKLI